MVIGIGAANGIANRVVVILGSDRLRRLPRRADVSSLSQQPAKNELTPSANPLAGGAVRRLLILIPNSEFQNERGRHCLKSRQDRSAQA